MLNSYAGLSGVFAHVLSITSSCWPASWPASKAVEFRSNRSKSSRLTRGFSRHGLGLLSSSDRSPVDAVEVLQYDMRTDDRKLSAQAGSSGR